jgi:hypothetical protein
MLIYQSQTHLTIESLQHQNHHHFFKEMDSTVFLFLFFELAHILKDVTAQLIFLAEELLIFFVFVFVLLIEK